MRILKRSLDRDSCGSITLLPEEPEDMWHAYNLIRPHDELRASALRRVTTTTSTGSTSSTRVHTSFTIHVLKLDFDPPSSSLHISGTITVENPYTKLGAYHTLDLTLTRPFTLTKPLPESPWDSIALATLTAATDPARRSQAVAVVMQEGLANICLLTEHQTILRQRVESAVPRKRAGAGSDAHDKGLRRFFAVLLATLRRQVDLGIAPGAEGAQPILLASPGFTAGQFLEYVMGVAREGNDKALLAQRPNLLVVHSSSGHVHALNEVLQSAEVLARLSDTKYAKETRLMDRFMEMLRHDDGRAWYGMREVERAVERGGLGRGGGVLLISDGLFRSEEIAVRRRWVELMERVKEAGGEGRVLSSAHESGKRLEGLGGVAAILTFPMEELGESEDEGEREDTGEGEVEVEGAQGEKDHGGTC